MARAGCRSGSWRSGVRTGRRARLAEGRRAGSETGASRIKLIEEVRSLPLVLPDAMCAGTPNPDGLSAADAAAALGQLPSGRHGLPRRVVEAHQRERILDGVTQAVCELGYARATIADIVLFARLSRRTFYSFFADKEESFLAAYDRGIEQIAEHVTAAVRQHERPADQLSAGIAAFIELIAAEPCLARLCTVEVIAAGPAALERREQAIRAFCRGMLEIARRQDGRNAADATPTTAELVVGGLLQIVNARVARGQVESLRADLPEMVYCALVPFCGQREATELAALIRGRREPAAGGGAAAPAAA
jgi:AcrR family transcriptional regulator